MQHSSTFSAGLLASTATRVPLPPLWPDVCRIQTTSLVAQPFLHHMVGTLASSTLRTVQHSRSLELPGPASRLWCSLGPSVAQSFLRLNDWNTLVQCRSAGIARERARSSFYTFDPPYLRMCPVTSYLSCTSLLGIRRCLTFALLIPLTVASTTTVRNVPSRGCTNTAVTSQVPWCTSTDHT